MAKAKRSKRKRPQRQGPARRDWRSHLPAGAATAKVLRELFASPEMQEFDEAKRAQVEGALPRLVNPDTGDEISGAYEAANAWPMLEHLHDVLTERLREVIESRGSAEWLWLLRRLRGQFHFNRQPTTDPYVQGLAETLAAGRARPSTPAEGERFAFHLDEYVVDDLVWLRNIAGAVYELHSVMKRCAKGEAVEFRRGMLPTWVPDEGLDGAIKTHDRRVARAEGNLLQTQGLATRAELDWDDNFDDVRLGGLVPIWQATSTRAPKRIVDPADPPPMFPVWLDLDRIPPLVNDTTLTPEHVALVLLLWAAFVIATRDGDGVLKRMAASVQWGYAVVHHEGALLPALEGVVGSLGYSAGRAMPGDIGMGSVADLLAVLEGLEPETWPPLMGNHVHRCGALSLVDLLGASRRVHAALVRPVEGASVNYWSKQFEKDVQQIIDDTPWAPVGNTRTLIGKKLKRKDGARLTDIDAVAARRGRLLLISCKSVAFTLATQKGDHAAVRNVTTKVHEAARDWQAVVDGVTADREVLGVSLPDADRIDGCVVLPAVPFYTERRWFREVVRGLPFVASSTELERALSR